LEQRTELQHTPKELQRLFERASRLKQGFDPIAETYDQWYETAEGWAIFNAELKCLRSVCGNCCGRWLEVGVGTGRFASGLGVSRGIDPSLSMLEIAVARGIMAYLGVAESLPFPQNSFDGVLMVMTLCFIQDSLRALKECCRILKSDGSLLLGIVPKDSPWGRAYARKKEKGHPIYSLTRFYEAPEVLALFEKAGFIFKESASTLFWHPDEPWEVEPTAAAGISPDAGFLGLLFAKRDH
jgi:ubiquinone/menaquinone biosynthesis C-methylase UbiE